MHDCRSQWPHGLRRRSAVARLLRSWVRIPPGAWTFVANVVVLSGRGLCDRLITSPEGSYRMWCVVVCYLETSRMRRPWPELGRSATKQNAWSFVITCTTNTIHRISQRFSPCKMIWLRKKRTSQQSYWNDRPVMMLIPSRSLTDAIGSAWHHHPWHKLAQVCTQACVTHVQSYSKWLSGF